MCRYIRCAYAVFSREITIHTVICGVHIRFWPTLQAVLQLFAECCCGAGGAGGDKAAQRPPPTKQRRSEAAADGVWQAVPKHPGRDHKIEQGNA